MNNTAFLPDTNILIYASKDIPPTNSLLNQWIEQETLALSVVSISEYLTKANPKELTNFNQVLYSSQIYDVDLEIATLAAKYRKQFIRKTKRSHILDCYLAATAKIHHLTLVTRNTGDFPMKDIKIINPFETNYNSTFNHQPPYRPD